MKKIVQQKINQNGLSSGEARERLKQFGENNVSGKTKFRPLVALIKRFNSPLLLILIVASLISFFLGESVNAIILLLMVFISAILDFVNTYKSEKAIGKLLSKVEVTATVIRDSKKKEISIKKIVPGDIIFLSAGDVVPADCRVLENDDFFVNQSVLTGESFPVEKIFEANEYESKLLSPEKNNLVFMGTSVVTGFATVLALRTGKGTEFGRIAESLIKAELETDFEKNIRKFSFFIMQLAIFLVGFVFLANAFLGHGWLTSFIFAVAIAIGLTPELLPIIISVSLSRGSVKMAEKDVIVKNLPSIQNFGSMNILCTDKTGTLTKNKIELIKYFDAFGQVNEIILTYAYLNSYYHSGIQNPLDNAIRKYRELNIVAYKKIDEIPFDFERKRQSIVVEKNKQRILITKGAPEEVFKVCILYQKDNQILPFDFELKKIVSDQFIKLSQEGFRILAVASKEVDHELKTIYSKSEEQEMIFLGFIVFLDPPKETVAETIKDLKNLGIELKIVTGDNELLTEKICRDINLEIRGVITGDQIDKFSDKKLQKLSLKTTIFARITPEQKERIILNLKKAGQVVGYLGDGINDAPALKAADVGISVNNAVDVAKETADIILLQKNLNVLKDGVIEGRKTFNNTMKYIMMGLSSNFGNMFSMMGASIFLPFLPMLPAQVLFTNLIYDASQLSLPSDKVDEDDIKKPTAWSIKFIRRYVLVIGPISSLYDFLTFILLFFILRFGESMFQTGWFIESIATEIFVVYIIRTKKLPFFQSKPSLMFFLNTFLAVVFAWAVPYTFIGHYLKFTPLPFYVLIIIFGMVVTYLILVEFVKRWFYKKFSPNSSFNRI
jgi:Mg2+-importing ATPase